MFCCLMGDLGFENQEAVISYNYLNKNQREKSNAIEIKIPINNAIKILDKFNINDFTIDEKSKEIKLLNFDLENTKDFENKTKNLIENLIKNNNYDTKRESKANAIESRYFEREDRFNSYKKWLETFSMGRRERICSLLSQAKNKVNKYIKK